MDTSNHYYDVYAKHYPDAKMNFFFEQNNYIRSNHKERKGGSTIYEIRIIYFAYAVI
jgi:hypothetical protein